MGLLGRSSSAMGSLHVRMGSFNIKFWHCFNKVSISMSSSLNPMSFENLSNSALVYVRFNFSNVISMIGKVLASLIIYSSISFLKRPLNILTNSSKSSVAGIGW